MTSARACCARQGECPEAPSGILRLGGRCCCWEPSGRSFVPTRGPGGCGLGRPGLHSPAFLACLCTPGAGASGLVRLFQAQRSPANCASRSAMHGSDTVSKPIPTCTRIRTVGWLQLVARKKSRGMHFGGVHTYEVAQAGSGSIPSLMVVDCARGRRRWTQHKCRSDLTGLPVIYPAAHGVHRCH